MSDADEIRRNTQERKRTLTSDVEASDRIRIVTQPLRNGCDVVVRQQPV
jgi:hypothetical protein